MSTPEIYRYLSYREYLADFVQAKAAAVRGFSQRQFARRAGISTGNYLGKVLARERNLGPKQAEKFIAAMGLGRSEAEYFRSMIALEKAESSQAKVEFLERMESLRKRKTRGEFVEDGEFYRHWYTAVIFELASCSDFDADPATVARALKGRISPGEAKSAVEFLIERGYLESVDGRLKQKEGVSLQSSQFRTNLFLRLSHRKMSELAAESVDLPMEERTFQGVLLALSKEQLPAIKERLKEFAEELVREFGGANSSADADRVYRFNLQAFPVAKAAVRRAKQKNVAVDSSDL